MRSEMSDLFITLFAAILRILNRSSKLPFQRFESPQRPTAASTGTMTDVSQSLHTLLERAQKQDPLGKLINEALVLIESVIDILGCVFSLCNLDRLLMPD